MAITFALLGLDGMYATRLGFSEDIADAVLFKTAKDAEKNKEICERVVEVRVNLASEKEESPEPANNKPKAEIRRGKGKPAYDCKRAYE